MAKGKWRRTAASVLLSTSLLFSTAPAAWAASFSDVDQKNPHYPAIISLTNEGIIKGYQDGRFGVWDEMTRQQAAIIMVRMLDLQTPDNAESIIKEYKDVSVENPAYKDLATAIKAGILVGSNGQFKPYAKMTREQVATMLVRSLNLGEIDSGPNVSINLANVSPIHRWKVQTLANLGITNAKSDFRPQEPITRGAFATMVYKAQEATHDKPEAEISLQERQVVELTNQERTSRGLKALEIDPQLSKVARAKSVDMQEHDYFSHNSPTYGSPFEMMKSFGIAYHAAGENIAKGQQTPEEVVQAWMNSEGHRANILNPNFTHIGVGYVADGNIWTQQFIDK